MNNAKILSILFIPPVANPFYQSLADALVNANCKVYTDTDEFWNPSRNYDVLHIHFPEFICGDISKGVKNGNSKTSLEYGKQLKYFGQSGTKIIWTVHNLKGHEQECAGSDNDVYSETVKFCHAFIVQAEIGKSMLINHYPSAINRPIITIPHGSYIGIYQDSVTKSEARKQLKIKDKNLVLLYFGLQRKYKDVYFVYKAFKASYKINKNIHLLLIGKPFTIRRKLFFWYIGLFNKNITINQNYIPDNEIQTYFRAADIAIFAYKNAFMSGGIILAQSFGKPVIAPNIGCLQDLVPETTGYLYKHNDQNQFSNTILTAVNGKLDEMGKNALEIQRANDWEEIGIITRNFYDSLLSD